MRTYIKIFSEIFPVKKYRTLDVSMAQIIEKALSEEKITEKTLSKHFRVLDLDKLSSDVESHLGKPDFKEITPPRYVLRLRFVNHCFELRFDTKEEAERLLYEFKKDKHKFAEKFVSRQGDHSEFRRGIEIRRYKRIFSLPLQEATILETPYIAVFKISEGWVTAFRDECLKRLTAFISKVARHEIDRLTATIRKWGIQLDFFCVPHSPSKRIFPEVYYFVEVKTFKKFYSTLGLTLNERDFVYHNKDRTLILRQVVDSFKGLLYADYFRMGQ